MRKAAVLALPFLIVSLLAAPAAASDWDDAVALFQVGNYAEAAAAFAAIAADNPEFANAHYMQGSSLLKLQRPADAAAAFERAVELGDGEPRHRLALIQAHLVAGDVAGGIASLKPLDPAALAAELQPAFASLLANAAQRSANPAELVPDLERATAAIPAARPLWVALGKAQEKGGDAEQALAAYRRALDLEREDGELTSHVVHLAWRAAGDAGSEAGEQRWQGAAIELAEQLAGVVATADSRLLAGEARMAAGEWGAAGDWFAQAAELSPDDPLPHYYHARCAAGLEEGEQALQLLELAAARDPDPDLASKIWGLEAFVLHRQERYAEAAAAYRKAGQPEKAAALEAVVAQKAENAAELAECERSLANLRALLEESRGVLPANEVNALEDRLRRTEAECDQYRPEDSGR